MYFWYVRMPLHDFFRLGLLYIPSTVVHAVVELK